MCTLSEQISILLVALQRVRVDMADCPSAVENACGVSAVEETDVDCRTAYIGSFSILYMITSGPL